MKKTDRREWSSASAYAIGLLVSDGSLSKDGRHFDFTSKDKDLIKSFQTCLSLQHCKIGNKTSGTNPEKKYYRVQFSDKAFHTWLQTKGIHPNKSLTIKAVSVPDDYFYDFLRGIFDGDGTIYSFRDYRWKNSTTVALGFASASPEFLAWLQKELRKRITVTGFITQGARVCQLRFGKKDASIICKNIYMKKNCPKLERKFAKVKKILRMSGF